MPKIHEVNPGKCGQFRAEQEGADEVSRTGDEHTCFAPTTGEDISWRATMLLSKYRKAI